MAETRGVIGRAHACAGTLSAAALVFVLCACAPQVQRAPPSESVQEKRADGAPQNTATPNASAPGKTAGPVSPDDWRALVPAPFGSRVGDIPFALKEVLLFRGAPRPSVAATGEPTPPDASSKDAEIDDQECYSKSGALPEFRGAKAADYVLCFYQERLFRVEAALRLPAEAGADTLSHWCADWLETATVETNTSGACEGRNGETAFAASMTPDEPEARAAAPGAAAPGVATPNASTLRQMITLTVYDIAARSAFDARASSVPGRASSPP